MSKPAWRARRSARRRRRRCSTRRRRGTARRRSRTRTRTRSAARMGSGTGMLHSPGRTCSTGGSGLRWRATVDIAREWHSSGLSGWVVRQSAAESSVVARLCPGSCGRGTSRWIGERGSGRDSGSPRVGVDRCAATLSARACQQPTRLGRGWRSGGRRALEAGGPGRDRRGPAVLGGIRLPGGCTTPATGRPQVLREEHGQMWPRIARRTDAGDRPQVLREERGQMWPRIARRTDASPPTGSPDDRTAPAAGPQHSP